MKLVPLPQDAVLKRLIEEERELNRRLAELEERVRDFEQRERPAYDHWVRLEFGPALQTLEEIFQKIRERRLRVERMNSARPEEADAELEREARRRAKLDAKRAARKEAQRAKKASKTAARDAAAAGSRTAGPAGDDAGRSARSRLVGLYRTLARRLHPDSPHAIAGPRAASLWLDVQAAYEDSSLERLLALAAWLESEAPEGSTAGSRTLAERHELIRSLKRSIRQLERRLTELAQDPAWGFGSGKGGERKKLRKRLAREIEDEVAEAQEALDAIEELIESIGPPRARKGRR